MSIEVTGPDGAVHEFPEGTAPEIIKGVMQKAYGAPKAEAEPVPTGEQIPSFDAMGNPTGGAQAAPPPASMPYGEQISKATGAIGGAADDIARQFANGATFGYGDKFAAKMGGVPLEEERAKSAAAAERSGLAGTAAGVAGMMAPASLIGKGVGVAGAVLEGLPVLGRILASPFTQAAGTGAIIGGADAAGHDTNVGQGAALGAALGAGGQAVGSVANKALGALAPAAEVPTGAALKAAARDAYGASENAGVIVNDTATKRLADALRSDAAEFGYSPYQQPAAQGVFGELKNVEGQNTTLKGLETLRKVAGRLRSGEGDEGELGRRFVNKIDEFTGNLKPSDLVTGNAPGAVQSLQDARSLWQRSSKATDLEDALAAAKLKAGRTGSGGNIDNATRQEVSKVLTGRNDWSADERQALEKAVTGGSHASLQNVLRNVGKVSPEGNGLMLGLHLGTSIPAFFTAHPGLAAADLATALTGFAAKRASDAMTGSNVRKAGELIRSGGDVSAIARPDALSAAQRALLARGLMGTGLVPATQ